MRTFSIQSWVARLAELLGIRKYRAATVPVDSENSARRSRSNRRG